MTAPRFVMVRHGDRWLAAERRPDGEYATIVDCGTGRNGEWRWREVLRKLNEVAIIHAALIPPLTPEDTSA